MINKCFLCDDNCKDNCKENYIILKCGHKYHKSCLKEQKLFNCCGTYYNLTEDGSKVITNNVYYDILMKIIDTCTLIIQCIILIPIAFFIFVVFVGFFSSPLFLIVWLIKYKTLPDITQNGSFFQSTSSMGLIVVSALLLISVMIIIKVTCEKCEEKYKYEELQLDEKV